jgi:hypothetical protein
MEIEESKLTTEEIRQLYDNAFKREIVLPETYKLVISKMCSEIEEVLVQGYDTTTVYNPNNFEPMKRFLVNVNIRFKPECAISGNKKKYEEQLNNYFTMTFGSQIDFIKFSVLSFIIPPEKSNEDKFFELFGINK